MTCPEAKKLIHGYLDDEVDLPRSLEIEEHLEQCPDCTGLLENLRALRSAIRQHAPYYAPPAGLERRIRLRHSRTWAPFAAVAAALVLACGSALGLFLLRSSGEVLLARELAGAHIRSLMTGHLTDVTSSDHHTVKPWFTGKVDFAPAVKDLAEQGFPLTGGRLDWVHGRTVAVLVYQRRKHFIEVFVWPGADRPGAIPSEKGFHYARWNAEGLEYWAVSDLNAQELLEFAHLAAER